MNQLTSSLDRRLALMQLSDSFFPSGSFTLSHGLESLVQSGQIRTSQEFQQFLSLLLHYKVGSSDVVALVHAYRASVVEALEVIRRVDRTLYAQTLVQESRDAQRRSGRALLMVAQSIWTDDQLEQLAIDSQTGVIHCLHPVIFGVVGRVTQLSESDVLFAFLHSFLTGLCGAAIRLGVLGHTGAQQVLRAIAPEIESVAQIAKDSSLEAIWTCTPFIDIAQMLHRQLPRRLFTN